LAESRLRETDFTDDFLPQITQISLIKKDKKAKPPISEADTAIHVIDFFFL